VLDSNNVVAQLIADKVHVHPATRRIAYRCKKASGIALITDAMEAVGLSDGTYDLGGGQVIVKNGEARTPSGRLAASTLTMDVAFKNIMSITGCSLPEAVMMSSTNAARSIGMGSSKGDVRSGFDADLAILDKEFNVVMTVVNGKLVFDKKSH